MEISNQYIGDAQFEELFPFFFVYHKEKGVLSCGKSLLKIAPSSIGCAFSSVFVIKRPAFISAENIEQHTQQIFILEVVETEGLLLRGQFLKGHSEGEFLFVGSPWIVDLKELTSSKLMINDFALHDAITDMMQIIKSKEIVMEDMRELANALKQQRVNLLDSEKALKASNAHLSALIHNLQSAILVEDEHRKILIVNDTFCSYFSIPYAPLDLVGVDCATAAEQSMNLFVDPASFITRVNEIVENEELVLNDVLYFKDGRILERDFIPINTDIGKRNFIWQYRDITQKKKIEKDLLAAKELAERSQKIKEDFLANMSHEIRTPLNAILGFSDVLKNTRLNDEQKDALGVISTAGENLMSIINDILDFTKIESGNIILENTVIDLHLTLRNVAKIFSKKAIEKNIVLGLTIDDDVPKWVNGDAFRLAQIMTNLIGNALKFTNEGSVKISCSVLEISNQSVSLNISVSDTGIGIPKDKMNSIFDRFTQAEEFTTRKFGGTGLGLSISKMLVELLGGSISCSSEYGKGSAFSFSIYFTLAEELKHVDVKPKSMVFNRSIRILMVEDNLLNQKLALKIIPSNWGVIDIAANGKYAIEFLQRGKYDLVLMDLQMPEMNGYETTKYIREELKLSVPIIAMTANAILGEKDKCLSFGMNAYLSKPFKANDLLEIIQSVFPNDMFKTDSSVIESTVLFTLDYLIEISEGDEGFVKDFVHTFIVEMDKEKLVLGNAMVARDFVLLKSLAHKYKASFVVLQAMEAEKLCKLIEQEIDEELALSQSHKLLEYINAITKELSTPSGLQI